MSGRLKQAMPYLLHFRAILLGISLFNFLSAYVFWHRIYTHEPPLEICCGAGFAPLLMVLCSISLQFRRIWADLIALVIGSILIYENSYRIIGNYAELFEISMWAATVRWWQFVSTDFYLAFNLLFGIGTVACVIISAMRQMRRS
jgi:hypothetical protein